MPVADSVSDGRLINLDGMTVLEWPCELPAPDRSALRAELADLIEQVIDEDIRALDALDDEFARMAAALLALLDSHEPDPRGRCPKCRAAACEVLTTIHQYLKQPLVLVWWHQLRRSGAPMSIDAVGSWLAASQTPHCWDEGQTGS